MSIDYQIEERLSEGCHILANDGQGDMIWGHVSARRIYSDKSIFMKPAGFGLDEINKQNLIAVNYLGEKTSGLAPVHAEVFIHTEIMERRKDVNAVVHTHPINSVVFSSLDTPLIPIGHEGAMFCNGLPVFKETSDLIVMLDLGSKVCDVPSDCNALIL
ncbi:class II aldolase/adducin family protein [Pseudomonas lopnurensis]|uniref:class II aldolase/adducin family protein n=1 Tax=Pseudomonas lopnurensis TaxID=1477517 RepID=UPI0028AA29C4|nr:class II aldolase/adducin family protein [Pseudomonas lopnurensis]